MPTEETKTAPTCWRRWGRGVLYGVLEIARVTSAGRAFGAATAKPAEDIAVTLRDHASTYGCLGNLLVVAGHSPPDAEAAQNYANCVAELVKKHPAGIGIITLVAAEATPHAEAREPLVRAFRDNWSQIEAALFVVEATGFGAAIQRSFMNALMLVSGSRDRVKIYKTLEQGSPWLLNRLSLHSKRAAVEGAVGRYVKQERQLSVAS